MVSYSLDISGAPNLRSSEGLILILSARAVAVRVGVLILALTAGRPSFPMSLATERTQNIRKSCLYRACGVCSFYVCILYIVK